MYPQWRIPEPLQTHARLAAMVAIAAAPVLLLGSALPRPLVLPVLCLITIAGAGVVSLIAWRRGAMRQPDHVTAWDVAGALAFIGFAAGMLSDPAQVTHLVEH